MVRLACFMLLAVFGCNASPAHLEGEAFNPEELKTLPVYIAKRAAGLPEVNLKPFCAPVIEQHTPTCFSFSTTYYGRTILFHAQRNNTQITPFSHGFSNLLAKYENDITSSCKGSSSTTAACRRLEKYGGLLLSDVPAECPSGKPSAAQLQKALSYRVSLRMLYKPCDPVADRIAAIKNAIGDSLPVMTGITTPASFDASRNPRQPDLWEPTETEMKNAKCDAGPSHSICVVGYHDNLYGGVFEIVNSWGTDWKNKGFTYVRYKDFVSFARYAVTITE